MPADNQSLALLLTSRLRKKTRYKLQIETPLGYNNADEVTICMYAERHTP